MQLSTRVESVTLYHRGATVHRTADLDFSAGVPGEFTIIGLPLALIDHTVRVRVETTDGDVVLSNVRVGLSAHPRGTPPRSPDEVALRKVRATLELRRDRIAHLEGEMGRLANIAVLPRPSAPEGQVPTSSPMIARAAMEQLAEDELAARVSLVRALRDEVRTLEEEAAALVRSQQLASTANHVRPDELTKSVHVTVAPNASPKKGRLTIDYFVVGARWAPAYQCRMTRDCRQADLQLRAMVCQRTGEDWLGATLNLSTASPMSWTELPELSAIRIGKAQPPPPSKRGFRPPPVGGSSLFADYDRGLTLARAALPVIPTWQPPRLVAPSLPAAPPPPPMLAEAPGAFDSPAEVMMSADESDDGAYEEEAKERVREEAPKRRSMLSPIAAPAPAPSMMMASKSAVAGPQGAGGAMKKLSKQREARDDSFGEASPLEASVEVLLHASLRLTSAGDAERGRLKPVDRRQVFIESLNKLGLVATFDVLALVEAAEAQGVQVGNLPAPQGTSDVRSEAGWYDYVYRTDASVDVPSDGTFHSVPVNTRKASGEVLYVVVPREDPQVYRQALVRNPLRSPLLPGPVEVYVAGEYVLTTTLPSVAPGGDFKLSLGVEQGIKVARNTKYREQRSGDKVVATNELIHDIDIEVVNNLDRDAQCEIRERIPHPAPEAEVVVEEGTVTPKWAAYRQEERGPIVDGGRRWVLSVKAGATQKLAAQYRVKLYANNELVGGNRREA